MLLEYGGNVADWARSSGNEALDTLAFLHLLEQLKVRG
jgi:hypothetical protein